MNSLLFKGLNIRILIIIPIRGRGFTNQGSTLDPQNPNPWQLRHGDIVAEATPLTISTGLQGFEFKGFTV